MNALTLAGRTILITGASSGIGRETALLISQLGGRLILIGRNEVQLAETAIQLEGNGHRVEIFDLYSIENIPRLLKRIAMSSGPLHGIVHSAGMHTFQPLRILSLSSVEQLMRINVEAGIGLAKGFVQRGVCEAGGSIVFVSSIAGLIGQSGIVGYAASKGAVVALTRALAVELSREQVRVNCVAPGLVMTKMGEELLNRLTAEQQAALREKHLLGFGTARDVSYAIAFLLADVARWITGIVLTVDGGYTAH